MGGAGLLHRLAGAFSSLLGRVLRTAPKGGFALQDVAPMRQNRDFTDPDVLYSSNRNFTSTGEDQMDAMKIVGIVLIVAGALGLAYGSFSYTKETHETKIGPIELSVKDKETINVPVWAGVGAILIGGVLLVVGGKKR